MADNTDAVRAGQDKAEFLPLIMKNVPSLAFGLFIQFWVIPWVFGKKEREATEVAEPTSYFTQFFMVVGTVVVMMCLVLAYLYWVQEMLLYVPTSPIQFVEQNPPRYQSPAVRDLKFEDISVPTTGGFTLHGWLMTHGDTYKGKDTIVFMHENAGNIGLRLDYFEPMCKNLNVNMLCFGYRGYGRSTGTPNEAGIQDDALKIAEYVKTCEHIDKNRVYLIGRSLGGAVAIHLIAKKTYNDLFKGVIIENTFSCIGEMAEKLFPFLKYVPKQYILKMNWDSLARVKEWPSDMPILFVTGDRDNFVPHEMTQQLFSAAASTRKQQWVVPGGDHNNTWQVAGQDYFDRIREFIRSTKESKEPASVRLHEVSSEEAVLPKCPK